MNQWDAYKWTPGIAVRNSQSFFRITDTENDHAADAMAYFLDKFRGIPIVQPPIVQPPISEEQIEMESTDIWGRF